MSNITFRFTTECEMTLTGGSYEEAYLQFKSFMHGDQQVAKEAELLVFPPESVQVFFDLNTGGQRHEISQFKGDFLVDIANNCAAGELKQQLLTAH